MGCVATPSESGFAGRVCPVVVPDGNLSAKPTEKGEKQRENRGIGPHGGLRSSRVVASAAARESIWEISVEGFPFATAGPMADDEAMTIGPVDRLCRQ